MSKSKGSKMKLLLIAAAVISASCIVSLAFQDHSGAEKERYMAGSGQDEKAIQETIAGAYTTMNRLGVFGQYRTEQAIKKCDIIEL